MVSITRKPDLERSKPQDGSIMCPRGVICSCIIIACSDDINVHLRYSNASAVDSADVPVAFLN